MIRTRAGGREFEFHYSEAHTEIRQADGSPLTEPLASAFIAMFLRVAVDSSFWEPFLLPGRHQLEEAPPLGSARDKLRQLVQYLVADGETTGHDAEWADDDWHISSVPFGASSGGRDNFE